MVIQQQKLPRLKLCPICGKNINNLETVKCVFCGKRVCAGEVVQEENLYKGLCAGCYLKTREGRYTVC